MAFTVSVFVWASYLQIQRITYPKEISTAFPILFSLTNQASFDEITIVLNITSFENVGIGFFATQLLNLNITATVSGLPFANKIQAMYFTFQDMLVNNPVIAPNVTLPPEFIQLEPNSPSHLFWGAYAQDNGFAFGGNYEPILDIWYGSPFNTTQMHQVFTDQYLQIQPISTAQNYVYALNNEYLTIGLTVFAIFEAGLILVEIYPKAFPKPIVKKENSTQNKNDQSTLENLVSQAPTSPKQEDRETKDQSIEPQDKQGLN